MLNVEVLIFSLLRLTGGEVLAKKKKMSKRQLLRAIDKAKTISDLFKLVKEQDINMRMHTLPSASNVAPKRLELRSFPPNTSHLDRLKAAVKLTVENTK